MSVYYFEQGQMVIGNSLWETLQLPEKFPMVISFVGGGGKTECMYRLADERAGAGQRVIVTTSTHIEMPCKNREVLLVKGGESCSAEQGQKAVFEPLCVKPGTSLVIGSPAGEGKLKGIGFDAMECLRKYADVVLIEADGAKRLPLKVPAAHEPVLSEDTDLVIACAGLDSLGHSLKDRCFRYQEAQRLLGVDETVQITPKLMAEILCHAEGSRKSVGNRAYRIILNKADNPELCLLGRQVVEEIRKYLPECICILCTREYNVGAATLLQFSHAIHNPADGINS